MMLSSPQNHEEESPAGNPATGLPLQARGGVSNSAACLGMSACTPPGLRLSAACMGMSTCTPPGLKLSTWEGVVVLKELILNKFLHWRVCWS